MTPATPAAPSQPGYFKNLDVEAYHRGPGVSKSILDLVHVAPALVQWSRKAPRDEEEVAAVDIGDAFHALILEPNRFKRDFVVAPEFNRRTNAGKAAYREFVEEAAARPVLTAGHLHQLRLMRESTLAHPYARLLLEEPGDVESSIYWIDPDTGLLCRCRPDKRLTRRRILLDVKTTADMDRFAASIEEFRYYVQDAFYSEGYQRHFGEPPDAFVFLAVSTSLDAGRYPVRCFVLPTEDREEGREEFRQDLATYAECERTGVWPGIETITRPRWKKTRGS